MKIYEKWGDTTHAGGFFNWYIVPKGDVTCLGVWNDGCHEGYGSASTIVYHLSSKGDIIEDDRVYFPESDDDLLPSGELNFEKLDKYNQKSDELLANSICMADCNTYSKDNRDDKTNPIIVFK